MKNTGYEFHHYAIIREQFITGNFVIHTAQVLLR